MGGCKLFDLQNTPASSEINCDGNDVEGLGRFLLEKAGWPAPIPRRGSAEKKATATAEEKRRSFTQGNFHVRNEEGEVKPETQPSLGCW